MRLAHTLLVLLLAIPVLAAKPPGGMTKGVANAALAAAAQRTPVRSIDYDQDRCDGRTVRQWLADLTGSDARSIVWTGGSCELTNDLNPMDAGSSWCAQATITPTHPKNRSDRPSIEVYFEKPAHGRPGAAYAFRGEMRAADGENYSRRRDEFEFDWRSGFKAGKQPVSCADE
jgi:hypothetical protein